MTKVAGMVNERKWLRWEMEKKKKKPVIGHENEDQWILYASNKNGSGVGMMLISPEGYKIHFTLCFEFSMSNNEAKYEALITGLRLVKELQAHNLKI